MARNLEVPRPSKARRRFFPGGVNSPVRAFARSAATRRSWFAAKARMSGTPTATSISTMSARGDRSFLAMPCPM